MAYALPIKIYDAFEEKLGKETASVVVNVLEDSIKKALQEAKQEQKSSLTEELKKELASKADIELVKKEIDVVRKEIDVVRKEIDVVRKEIELVRLEFKKDLRIVTIILLSAIIILNQNAIELIARLLGVLK